MKERRPCLELPLPQLEHLGNRALPMSYSSWCAGGTATWSRVF